jgi:hypothetical protein
MWLGAGAGLLASELGLRGRKREEELLLLARLSAITPVALPILGSVQAQARFTAPGAFSFAMPLNFVVPDPETTRIWQAGSTSQILVAAQDGASSPNMFFAVYDGNELLPAVRGQSVWVMAVLADEFRQRAQATGTPAIMGPTPILVAGERAIWFVLSKWEDGFETHKWTVETFHNGRGYVATMHLRNGVDAMYTEAFWTTMGSWVWADSGLPPPGEPQPPPTW